MIVYSLDIAADSLKRGRLFEACSVVALWIRNRAIRAVQYIFVNDLTDHAVKSLHEDDILRTSSHEEVAAWVGLNPGSRFDLARAAAQGARFWMIRGASGDAGYIVTKKPHSIASYFFPLPEDSVYLAYSYIAPDMRGGGVFSRARMRLLDLLASEGASWLVTNCDVWNIPAKKVIERSGGVLVGKGWKRRDSSRVFVPCRMLPWIAAEPVMK